MKKVSAVFVIGHSPAIVTETLAALYFQQNVLVEAVTVISTYSGASALSRQLFESGAWEAFTDAYPEYQSCNFSSERVLACAGEDIRNEAENRSMAESIFSTVQELTAEGMPSLMASIAGGRKTMGYYMGFAMSLFGRKDDWMTHVLVPEAWEKDRGFLFPQPQDAGRIDLIDIPFIRLRGHLKPSVGKADIEALIHSAQSAIDLSVLEPVIFRIRRRSVSYLGKAVEFSEREFSILQFFAARQICP
ncbi:MAG: TIGR02584 family CRISPR-associated protein [Zetaproteobacteria bacterium CG_4_9_14_3_um_filter_49_83]|nr:MAG: CRISPR-associated protein [Zetaproteobacteria bacterium CG1_02_49_23]PIQ33363.1 MAG: TIGR02584 family CRISPR-associated protein [Zetaproteobacteria bacterium CG17_big_fil_post_rev_8_21_14_2_50_50_13]PIV31489.1 MAG: TIGR02584 family CRISPR-associated protein [Zetaproteobacteria bacterium CG02_land_8_20_14_3_00_50_9]PIY57095.1 MAG: TIGR02584 family CRISPR-associated protein [Zetaproteobacteria bacterium CG_4_10_14_0_8_um_filter_49_80]PJA35061.1 MAG: TIGR02584 family CRISPR-associated prot